MGICMSVQKHPNISTKSYWDQPPRGMRVPFDRFSISRKRLQLFCLNDPFCMLQQSNSILYNEHRMFISHKQESQQYEPANLSTFNYLCGYNTDFNAKQFLKIVNFQTEHFSKTSILNYRRFWHHFLKKKNILKQFSRRKIQVL